MVNVEDRVADAVAAWAPDLAAQAEVLAALFDDVIDRTPDGRMSDRCGTPYGYELHRSRDEEACTRCKAANAERSRKARVRRAAKACKERPEGQQRLPCGSNAAYHQHLYYRELPVDPACLAAHADFESMWAAARRVAAK